MEVQETLAVPEPARLFGVIGPHVRPDGMVSVRLTVPPKPLTLVMVIVDEMDV